MKNLKKIFLIITLLNFNIIIPMSKDDIENKFFKECIKSYFKAGLSHNMYPMFFKTRNKNLNPWDVFLLSEIGKYTTKKFKIKDKNLKQIEKIIEYGANVNLCDKDGLTLLHVTSIIFQDIEVVKLLLYFNVNIDKPDKNGGTPLLNLVLLINSEPKDTSKMINKFINIIKLLIISGADYRIKDHQGNSYLDLKDEGSAKKIKNIINIKQNIMDQIYKAIDNDSLEEMKILLLKGYKYFYDFRQNNILHIAALKNKSQIFLLIFKALPELINQKNQNGLTPIDLNPGMLIYLIHKKIQNDKIDQLSLNNNNIKEKFILNEQRCNLM